MLAPCIHRHQLEKSLLVDPWNTVKEADLSMICLCPYSLHSLNTFMSKRKTLRFSVLDTVFGPSYHAVESSLFCFVFEVKCQSVCWGFWLSYLIVTLKIRKVFVPVPPSEHVAAFFLFSCGDGGYSGPVGMQQARLWSVEMPCTAPQHSCNTCPQ